MANSASHAALPFPVKNARFSILIPYLDADGDPTDPSTPDTEFSVDAGAFADCAEEVTTISGSNGMGYITLTGAEMDGSMVAVAAKAVSGPKYTLATLYPRVLPILRSGTAQAGAGGTITLDSGAVAIDDYYNGCIIRTTGGTGGGGTGGANNQARVITDYNGSTKVATISPNWETNPDATTTFDVLLTEMSWLRYGDLQAWRGAQPNALVSSRVDASVGAMAADVLTASAIASDAIGSAEFAQAAADKVWSSATRSLTDKAGFALSAAGIQAIWDAATAALSTAGSIGKLLVDNVNATISSRASQTSLDTVDDYVDTEVAAIKAKTDQLTFTVANQVDANTLSIGATAIQAIWDRATASLSTAGSIGKLLVDNIDAAISSRSSHSAADVWASATRTLTAFGFSVTVGTNNDKSGYALSAAGVQAIWDALTTALTTVGSIGKLLVDNVNATISSRATQTSVDTIDDYVDTEIAAIKAKTDNLPASPAATGDAMQLVLAQSLDTGNTGDTVGGALLAARAQGFGRWTLVGTTLTIYAADGTTVVRTFTLDSGVSPTSRT